MPVPKSNGAEQRSAGSRQKSALKVPFRIPPNNSPTKTLKCTANQQASSKKQRSGTALRGESAKVGTFWGVPRWTFPKVIEPRRLSQRRDLERHRQPPFQRVHS